MNLEAFLLPDDMDQMPDLFVVGTQESGGSRSEWEVCCVTFSRNHCCMILFVRYHSIFHYCT